MSIYHILEEEFLNESCFFHEIDIKASLDQCIEQVHLAIHPFLSYRRSCLPYIIHENELDQILNCLQPQLTFYTNDIHRNMLFDTKKITKRMIKQQKKVKLIAKNALFVRFCPVCLIDHCYLFSGSCFNTNQDYIEAMLMINPNKKHLLTTNHQYIRIQEHTYSLCSIKHRNTFLRAYHRYAITTNPHQVITRYIPSLRVLLIGQVNSNKKLLATQLAQYIGHHCQLFSLYQICYQAIQHFVTQLIPQVSSTTNDYTILTQILTFQPQHSYPGQFEQLITQLFHSIYLQFNYEEQDQTIDQHNELHINENRQLFLIF